MVQTITQTTTSVYMLGDLVSARRSLHGVVVETEDGESVDLHVPEGDWAIVPMTHQGFPFVQTDAAFRSQFLPVRRVADAYVSRGKTVKAAMRGGRMVLDDGTSRSVDEFLDGAVRVGLDGEVLCHAGMPLHMQARLLLPLGDLANDHLDALKACRGRINLAFANDEVTRDALMYDAVMAQADDDIPDGVALHYANAVPHGYTVVTDGDVGRAFRLRDDTLLDRLAKVSGIPAGAFDELRHVPFYPIESFRALARDALTPFIGTFPMEEVLHAGAAETSCFDKALDWARGGRLLDRSEGLVIPAVPDYVTSEAFLHARDGIVVLTFSDRFGSHLLAWPDA